jgi:Xaa-Pro aminopeptidase
MAAKIGLTPTSRITFGLMQVDWENRIDFEKMRRERLQRARDAMEASGVDYLILLRAENARYATGIKRLYWPTIRLGGGPAVVLPRNGKEAPGIWITDIEFASKAVSWIPRERFGPGYEMDKYQDVEVFSQEVVEMFGSGIQKARIGVDIWSPAMHEALPKKFPAAELVDGQQVMNRARRTKTQEEIACMKMGYVISEAGMQAALEALKPGIRECELVGACFQKFWELGSETTQCSEVVNSGPGSFPYRRFHTDRIVQAGDMVNMDFGACFNGYFGDFCRAFVCGKRPSKQQAELLRRAYDLQMEALGALRPGVSPAAICKELGRKSIGHGIGIAAFETPHLRCTDEFIIQPGMTFSVTTPMDIGTPTAGGVHLEDETVMTEDGCEVYSTFPYTGVDD